MNLNDLTVLQEVARAGSFAAAARARDVDPSSIGRIVAGLEAELGLRIFERSTRRMELTEAGAVYLSRTKHLIDDFASAAEEARAVRVEPRGILRLSASVAFGQNVIVPRLAAFCAQFPEVQIEGVFSDANVDLVAERIDLAIRLAPAVAGDYIVTKLMNTTYRVVATQTYLGSAAPLLVPSDLAFHRAVLFPFRDYRSRWLFRGSDGKTTEQEVQGDITLSSAGALRDAALAGLGPALLPDWLVDKDIANGRLYDCFEHWDVTATSFETAAWLVYPSRSYLPAKVRAMIDFLKTGTTT